MNNDNYLWKFYVNENPDQKVEVLSGTKKVRDNLENNHDEEEILNYLNGTVAYVGNILHIIIESHKSDDLEIYEKLQVQQRYLVSDPQTTSFILFDS